MDNRFGLEDGYRSSPSRHNQRTSEQLYLQPKLIEFEEFDPPPLHPAMTCEQHWAANIPPLFPVMPLRELPSHDQPALNFPSPPLHGPPMTVNNLETKLRGMIISNQQQRQHQSQIMEGQPPSSSLPPPGFHMGSGCMSSIPSPGMPLSPPPYPPHMGFSSYMDLHGERVPPSPTTPSSYSHFPPQYFQQQYPESQYVGSPPLPASYPNTQSSQSISSPPPQYRTPGSPNHKTSSPPAPSLQVSQLRKSQQHLVHTSAHDQRSLQQPQRPGANNSQSRSVQTTPQRVTRASPGPNLDHFPPLVPERPKNISQPSNETSTPLSNPHQGPQFQPIAITAHKPSSPNRGSYDSHRDFHGYGYKRNFQSTEAIEQISKEQNMHLDALAQKIIAEAAPLESEKRAKLKLLEKLEEICQRVCPDAQLIPFGSFVTGFATTLSDLDVIFTASSFTNPKTSVAPVGSLFSPNPDFTIPQLLEKELQTEEFDALLLTKTRVPILKLVQHPTEEFPHKLHCDMGFSNLLALHNTQLLSCYSRCDGRLKDMVLFIKWWAKRRHINNPYRGTLSSYGYSLMILHYLINVVRPPVLYNLQTISTPEDVDIGELYDEDGYGDHRIWFHKDISTLEKSTNVMHLGELLRGFFEYYAYNFQWGRDVISIRTKDGILTKQQKGWVAAVTRPGVEHEVKDRYLFAIEDPFEIEHNVSRTCNNYGVSRIREELKRAVKLIRYKDGGKAVTEYLCMEAPEERTWFRREYDNRGDENTGVNEDGRSRRDMENAEHDARHIEGHVEGNGVAIAENQDKAGREEMTRPHIANIGHVEIVSAPMDR